LMATAMSESKSGFLKEFFVDNPDADKAQIDEAWQKAGNEGTISGSTIYNVRRELDLIDTGRGKAKKRKSVGAGKRSSAAPKSEARNAGSKAGRSTSPANGRAASTDIESPAKTRARGGDLTRTLIELEGQLDHMIHQIKLEGGLPEFEEALRKARRILARSHEE
jgi:hypothetical protein